LRRCIHSDGPSKSPSPGIEGVAGRVSCPQAVTSTSNSRDSPASVVTVITPLAAKISWPAAWRWRRMW
jgi:hypothetical protein